MKYSCLTAYDIGGRSEWECVIGYGSLASVPESDFGCMDDGIDDNAWFPGFHPPDWQITGVSAPRCP